MIKRIDSISLDGGIEMVRWSEWIPIGELLDYKGLATYEISIVRNRKPIPVKRWCSTDQAGIVCIGQGILKQRVYHFYYAVIRRQAWASHSAGILYSILKRRAKLFSKSGNHQLEIRYCPVISKKKAKKLEAILLKKYLMKFGELPPLNSAIPSKVWKL